MKTNPFLPSHRPAGLFAACAVGLLSLGSSLSAAIDDAVSQAAWRMTHGVTPAQLANATWMSQDADRDGESNGDECAAGTNPFQSTSVIAISGISVNGNQVQLTFPTTIGKQYVVQKNGNLTNTGGWSTIPLPLILGDGNARSATVAREARVYYRVLVQDYDADGDQVSDYAENVFHYNADSAFTGGAGGPSDHAAIAAALAAPNVVRLTSDDPAASEDTAETGKIVVRRTGGLEAITVPISVSGSATPGADYSALPATVTLPVGINSVTLNVVPMPDALAEGGEIVTVTPSAGSGYTLSGAATCSVLIEDSTTPTGTGLTGRYYDTSNAIYTSTDNFNPAQLKATRIDPTVNFVWNTGIPTASTLGTAGNENWAARFDGFLVPSVTGNYVFDVQADDGARVYVDNVLVIDAWAPGSSTTTPMQSAAVALTAGTAVPIRVEYQDVNGTASVSLRWITPGGGAPAAIPGANVFLDAGLTVNGWSGLYWNNTAFIGLPRFGDYPATLTLNWGTGQPTQTLPSADNFSAKWEGYLRANATGNFTFDVQADEAVRVYLNNTLIIDGSVPGSATAAPLVSATIPLTSGVRYPIRVEFADTTGNASVALRWITPSTTTFAAIPVSNIYRLADTTNTVTGLWATYYSNATFSGRPLYSVQDTATNAVTYNYAAGMPAAASLGTAANDNWAAAIDGYLRPTVTGSHTFTLQADDGARLYINNVLVADGWAPGSALTAITSSAVPLTAGVAVPIRVEYYELTSTAALNVNWRPPGSASAVVIPAANLFQDAAQTSPGLTANYWRNATMVGPHSFTDHPTGLNTAAPATLNWSTGQPSFGLTVTNYSAKWEGNFAPTTTGTHRFDIQASDGARVYLNGNLIIDAWTANSSLATPMESAPIELTAGTRYPIRVEFYDATAEAVIRLRWLAPAATTYAAIPTTNIFREATGALPGYLATYYSNTTLTEPSSHSAVEAAVNYEFGAGAPVDPAMQADTFTVRWTGQVQPQYTDEYTFVVNCDDSAKLWINGQPMALLRADTNALVDWPTSVTTTDRYARISLVAGQRYDIQLDYYEATGTASCQLYWYCASQPRQIIPQSRLYPTSVTPAPAMVMSPTVTNALVGGPFSYKVQGSNGSTVTVSGLPAWLSYSGGIISGVPPVGALGTYQIVITSANSVGSSQSLLNIDVTDTGRTITREFWNGVAGTAISSIPLSTAPSGTAALSSLASPSDFGDDYGTRIRGFITPPVTGNYYFWIRATDNAELWISNDDEPINKLRRASVSGGVAGQSWNVQPSQKSPWLALQAGRRYYLEVLHKAGTGAGDQVQIGWAKPGQTTTDPSEVVPGYALSDYVAPSATSTPGTLYVATMLAQGDAITDGRGTATMRVSEDETVAYIRFEHSGLSGGNQLDDWHIHSDPFLTHSSAIIYDGVEPPAGDGLQPDGSHKWTITGAGTLTTADVRELIKQGKAYINLHTALYPNGEIRGNFTAAGGSRTFTPPPAPPTWTDDSGTDAGAARFLTQATYGPSAADIVALKSLAPAGGKTRYELWIEDQFTKPASQQLPEVLARTLTTYNTPFDETLTFNAWWMNSISGQDQLRQRLAFALSEIAVVSAQGPLADNARALSYYYDRLAEKAFGNFREILETVSLTPSMGRYLDALRNDKPDKSIGRIPNENYAREIMQLFSIGLFRMWPDGTLQLNSKDQLVPTYSQDEIVGVSHVFTGWEYGYDGAVRTAFNAPTDWTRQMRDVPARHFTGPKRILNNEVLPGLASVGGAPLDPYATHGATQYNDAAYVALPRQELDAIHDQLFTHPNCGPFICRQLIQRLVTSNPSRDYLFRVVQKFNDNGSGVRGDMQAVVKAILLDYEARSTSALAKPDFGKQREPVMRVAAAARAFRTEPYTGTWSQNGTRTLSVTTSIPHRLVSGNSVFLDYKTGSPLPTPGIHSVTVTGANSYTVTLPEWIGAANTTPLSAGNTGGTYRQLAGSTTVTVYLANHWIDNGLRIYLKCLTGPGIGVLDGLQTCTSYYSTSSSTFTFEAPGPAPTTERSGNIMAQRFTASYVVSNSGLSAPNDKRVTFNTFRWHNLAVGDRVSVNYSNGNPVPVDSEYVVSTVVDQDTFTVLAPSAGTLLNNQQENTVYIFPHPPQPLVRNGDLVGRASTYALGSTEGDVAQSPLNAPTVFNFFLPDYKFPGALASQGITTPEFEDTSDTNVVRQANFFYNGVFNPSNTNGLSSFRQGSNALVMDLGPWMGNATDLGLGAGADQTKPWTNNENLATLVDKMGILLAGGQLPAGAKAIALAFLNYERTIGSISVGNPCTITTTAPHNLGVGYTVVISGVSGGTFTPAINSSFAATVTGPNTFTIPVSCTSISGLNLASARIQNVGYNNAAPTDTNKRDRIRSLVHLILTSADYTIQR